MERPLRLLVVEDVADDAEMMILALQRGGLDPTWERVETADELAAALANGPWDAVVSDYTLPKFGALAALAAVRAIDPDLPFLVVSGTVGEEVAAGTMRAGASDYVLKQNLTRLAPALSREVQQAENRRTRRAGERAIAHLAAVVESSDDAITSQNLDGAVSSWNAAAERLYGWTAAEAMGRQVSFLVPPDKADELAGIMQRLREGQKAEHLETVRQHRDGTRIDIALTVSPVRAADGRLVGVSKTARDIRERKRMEVKLRANESRQRAILDSALDCLITIDQQGSILEFNPAAERTFGYAHAAVIGQPVAELIIPPTDRAAHDRGLARFLETGEGPILDRRIEVTALRADGTAFPVELTVTAVRGQGTHMFTAFLRDITDRKRLEDQVRQAQKMDAIGQLAGGVAHDFNNLLTVITGFSELLLQRLRPDDPTRKMVDEIRKAGERSAGLTRQLLTFSRQEVVVPRVLGLNQVITDLEKMLHRIIGEDVKLSTALGLGLGSVQADPGQIDQVIMNLVVNARDAMPQGGQLTIETQNTVLDEDYVRAHPAARLGPHVLLAVSDTGSGITPEVQAKIFEPFFTTKGVGKGTGLGLAVVHGIVQQSGGHIALYSEVGIGTTFKVYLPRVDQLAQRGQPGNGPGEAPRGGETVLLAEDEEAVRAMTRLILEMHGYTVMEAASGEEALRVAEQYRDTLHLLVTDVVMPGLGGRKVAEQLQVLHPETKVLFLSGYTDDAVIRHGILHEQVNFLQKPFSPLVLANKVRAVLDGA
jgi:two-component system cell cycle sensor histidine kinase/response regulator CckA